MAILGRGTTLSYAVGSGEAEVIGFLTDVKQPAVKCADVEITDYESAIELTMPGYVNAGEVQFEVKYHPTQSAAVYGLLGEPGVTWVETLPDGSTWTFEGYLNSLSGEIPMKAAVKNTFKIKCTSKPVHSGSDEGTDGELGG